MVSALVDGTLLTSNLPDGLAQMCGVLIWVPSITLTVRRLHDVGRSGWWLLSALTGIGPLLLLFWDVQPGDAGPNRYTLPPWPDLP